MPNIENGMRERIAEFLPCALEKAIGSYEDFMDQSPEKAGDFKAHHDACKVALAHMELLVKLARWADLPDPQMENADHQKMLMTMIESARGELEG
ncbi:MAG: hypothetical protein IT559_06535 [Alphaproteobacteria bacterium]|nr:hypothetical protein [Alphaproteobacteria bacterium]